MLLKYAAHLAKCRDQPCPCEQHKPRDLTAFRFMHNPATEDPDFVPTALLHGRTPTPSDKCGRFGLSFFVSLAAARDRYKSLSERLDAAQRYGSSVGEIDLTKADGRSGEPDKNGHFNLHIAVGVSLAARVNHYYNVEEG